MNRGRIWVDAWSPEYGGSVELGEALASSVEDVDPGVESKDWKPVEPGPVSRPEIAFIDGVSRIDARALVDLDAGMAQGICASVGVGSVLCGVDGARAEFGPHEVERCAIFGSGAEANMPSAPDISYSSRSVAQPEPECLLQELQTVRSDLELEMARRLAQVCDVVVADGPLLARREPSRIIGMIKSHQKSYLPAELEVILGELAAGCRTPLFQFGAVRPRYSWYVRLSDQPGGHRWSGLVRCEVSSSLSLNKAVELADITAVHLPNFASKAFWDSRAPQNLVPIATLERRLWHLLGDRQLVFRKIRSALERDLILA